jgi:hypothetical protein
MSASEAATSNSVSVGRRRIAEQRERIARQRELLSQLERDRHLDMAEKAHQLLASMLELLTTMERGLAAAEERLSDADPLDETVMDKVSKECPL